MKLSRVLLLAAVAAIVACGAAQASSPSSSTELRTQRVVSQTATGTNTLTTFGTASGIVSAGSDSNTVTLTNGVATTLWTLRSDSLVVIDWILYSSTAGAVDEVWTVNVYDDNGVAIVPLVAQTVAANTADFMLLPCPTGLPLFNGTVVSTVVRSGNTPCSSGYNVSVTGPTASGGLSIGYHMELPGDRVR